MNKRVWISLGVLVLCLIIVVVGVFRSDHSGDTEEASESSRTFFAMDTVMTLNVSDATSEQLQTCVERVLGLEALFSVTNEDSEISRVNETGTATISADTRELLRFALNMCDQTQGALDITMYPVVRAWGFTTGNYTVPEETELARLLEKVDYRVVTLQNDQVSLPIGTMVDLGSVAKGYASDVLAELLRNEGVSSGILDLGGNIYCMGNKEDGSPWRIALRDPFGDGYSGSLYVTDRAVVTSGAYERYFEADDGRHYGHIFDPSTGRPVDNGILSVTVVDTSGAMCDALSTALFVMGPERAVEYLSNQNDVDAVLLCDDETIFVTSGLQQSFSALGEFADWQLNWIDCEGIT